MYNNPINVVEKPVEELASENQYVLIGDSPVMTDLRNLIKRIARSNTTVLITGETGTGKELVARAIHDSSPRRNKPFIDVNCAAMTDTLVESELFGHEKGAYTGAFYPGRGKFELADGGTLFLDEIGDMPLNTQTKILRVLEERTFERVGGERKLRTNVRVICATNRNLPCMINKGMFRLDLYYRINTIQLDVPPLRSRVSDIPVLLNYFLQSMGEDYEVVPSIPLQIMPTLCGYTWPGNVRELRNFVEYMLNTCTKNEVSVEDLPSYILNKGVLTDADGDEECFSKGGLEHYIHEMERSIILQALKKSLWNKTKAAKYLKITRRILGYKMTQLGIGNEGKDDDDD